MYTRSKNKSNENTPVTLDSSSNGYSTMSSYSM